VRSRVLCFQSARSFEQRHRRPLISRAYRVTRRPSLAVRQSSRKKLSAGPAAPGGLELGLPSSTARVFALLKERDRLVREIDRKRRGVERAIAHAEACADSLAARFAPFREQLITLRSEIDALFTELLTPGQLSARARKQVAQVRSALRADGVLESDPESGDARDHTSEPDSRDPQDDDFPDPRVRTRPDAADRTVAAAAQHGQESGRESLRAVFRRLALTMHPDRARDEQDRQRRTRAMQDVTRAYEEGDLARLIALEKAWSSGSVAPTGNSSNDTARIRELERTNRELRAQAATLARELRAIRRSAPPADLEADELVAGVELELERVAAIRDFIRAFRDGRISLAQFLLGPDDLALELVMEAAFAAAPQAAFSARRSGSSSRGRRRKRS